MMKFARFIIAFYMLTLVSIAAFAQLTDAEKVDLPEVNLLKNSGFEHGTNSWKKNGGTVIHVTSGANLLFGKGSVTFDASQDGDYIESEPVTIPAGLENKNCIAWIYYKGGSSNYELRVYDGSNSLVASRAIEGASATAEKIEVGFPCGVAGSQYKLRVHATGDGDLIALDRGYLGELSGIHIGTVAQATFVGAALFGGEYGFSTNSLSNVDVVDAWTFDTDDATFVGSAQPHETPNIFGAKFDVTPGRYIAKFHAGAFRCLAYDSGLATSINCQFIVMVSGTATIADKSGGLLYLTVRGLNEYMDVNSQNEITFEFTVTSPGTVSLKLVANVSDTSGWAEVIPSLYVYTTPVSLTLYRYPTESEQVMRIGQGADFIGNTFFNAGTTCPTGSLKADGSAVSRTKYATLFNRIGTTYGDGDGSTTFNLPNNSSAAPADHVACIYYVSQPMPLVKQSVVYDDKVRAEGKAGVTSIDSNLDVDLTASNTTNLDSTPFGWVRYIRIGDQVEATLFVSVNPTNAGSPFSFRSTIPVPSNFTGPFDAMGVCVTPNNRGTIQVTASMSDGKFEFRGSQSTSDYEDYICKVNYVVR